MNNVHNNHTEYNVELAARDLESIRLVRAIQSASARRKHGTYHGVQHTGESFAVIVWDEGRHLEAVCVADSTARTITYLDAAEFCHPELEAELSSLIGWTSYRAADESPIAFAARGSL